MRILLVEDDESLGKGVKRAIERDSHVVEWLQEGNLVADVINTENFELVILDLTLPDKDGLDIIQLVRQANNPIPILVLTARDSLDDKIKGLDLGADDYLVKPFELSELKARIRALSRRSHGQSEAIIVHGDITINTATMQVQVSNTSVPFSRREYALLLELVNHSGQILSKDHLETILYGWNTEIESNTVEVHIHHLRKKLPSSTIHTVRGLGYRFQPHE